MAFSPENPERPQDLVCICNPDTNQAITIFYDSADGLFYRYKGQWKEISPEATWELEGSDGSISFYVHPSLIPIYDEADMNNLALTIETVAEHESVPKTSE